MVEYVSQAMKRASHGATVLLYSPDIDPFLEDLVKSDERVISLKRGREIHRGWTAKTWRKMKDREDIGSVLVTSLVQKVSN
jgi:hypothetical protein